MDSHLNEKLTLKCAAIFALCVWFVVEAPTEPRLGRRVLAEDGFTESNDPVSFFLLTDTQ